ncbi:MAG: hypothetical protein ACLVB5_10115 [Christensenellales bacterium]
MIFHSVNLDCDRKFRNFFNSTRALHRLSDTICIENGYSIVADPKRHGQAYNKWLGDRAKLPQREAIRILIDDALAQKPADLDALLELLKAVGCRSNVASRSAYAALGRHDSNGWTPWGKPTIFPR